MAHLVTPTMPMESRISESDGAERTFTCYTAPGVVFHSEEEMKQHYRSEWHRQNLKRKVAGLPPLSLEAFEERAARYGNEPPGSDATAAAAGTRSQQRRQKREEKAVAKAARAAANPNSKAAHYQATKAMTEEQYVQHKVRTAEAYDVCCDLFSRHKSADMHANLEYMAKTHGFYIPYLDYCKDVEGLLSYLLERVYVGNVALMHDKQFHSVEAVQAHMKSKNQCRFELEGHEEEYGEFYDLEALAERSPLWQYVEVEDDDEEDWVDADEEEADTHSNGGGDNAEGGELEGVLERLRVLGILSEAEVDRITDSIAEGTEDEAQALTKMKAKLKAAEGSGPSDQASTSRSRVTMAVRYRTMGDLEAGALTVSKADGTKREIGHRSMKAYYKQSYRPADTSLGVVNPALERLMLQYAEAGVLTTRTDSNLSGYRARGQNEMSYNAQRIADKKHMQQGLINNTTAKGMKHFKNQSLNF
ncbi:hypothetical protein AB1Y20_019324 [Prymnesium parvum]|uniref:ZN622/Rei1/Reh1 zinc finger C2H2-type domain-containing protein n=1 Tax=Prymnesium parvum TaxID=97485 RepID=A0AB34JQW6_PRYPA